jgi:hypothetical protein
MTCAPLGAFELAKRASRFTDERSPFDEKSFGSEHPNAATDLNNLADLLRATNGLAEAEPLYRQVLRILAEFGHRTWHKRPYFC